MTVFIPSLWEEGECAVGCSSGTGWPDPAVGGWPLPSLSSWQMKEPKQSSLALSNAPGTPRPDPPTASRRGQRGGQPRLQGRGSRACFPSPGPGVRGRTHARQLVARSCPAGGECGAGRGVSGHSGQGHPAPGTPSPTPSPSSCAGASPTENENSGRGNGGRRPA